MHILEIVHKIFYRYKGICQGACLHILDQAFGALVVSHKLTDCFNRNHPKHFKFRMYIL